MRLVKVRVGDLAKGMAGPKIERLIQDKVFDQDQIIIVSYDQLQAMMKETGESISFEEFLVKNTHEKQLEELKSKISFVMNDEVHEFSTSILKQIDYKDTEKYRLLYKEDQAERMKPNRPFYDKVPRRKRK